jgi:hypothetical protein
VEYTATTFKGHYILLHNFTKIVYIHQHFSLCLKCWCIYTATTPPSSGYLRWQIIDNEWITEHGTGFQSTLGIDILPDITEIKYYLISFYQNWNEFRSVSPVMISYQTNRLNGPPNSSCGVNLLHIVVHVAWEVIIEYMTERTEI